jgi:chaperonin GroES
LFFDPLFYEQSNDRVKGEVIAIGNGKKTDDGKTIALDVAIGNIVLFDQYAGSEVKIDGESLLVMRENDVIAIIE